MCGFTGILDLPQEQSETALRESAERMTAALVHRGPDGEGTWVDASVGIAMGHRRLAILDLSPAGSQPMESASGRFITAYNGEIYNHPELRQELLAAGHQFRGSSDTETLLAASEEWGVEQTLPRLNGMFAFAIWDRQQRRLSLARDRLGIKPLYYGRVGQQWIWASELKALRQFPQFSASVDRRALALFLQHNYIPAPYTIYDGICKLPPAACLNVASGPSAVGDPQPRPFWSLDEAYSQAISDPWLSNDGEAVGAFEELLGDSVRRRLASDVPLGTFLSGGVDSTAITALAQAHSSQPIKTFCIGFEERQYDESQYAAAVAQHLGTDHTSLRVSPRQAMDVIPLLPTLYDEPFADSSQIPTYLVSQLARRDVTVALSGDGGDELFGGYDRYALAERLWRIVRRVPKAMRPGLADSIHWAGQLLPLPRKARTLGRFLTAGTPSQLYAKLHTHWKNPARIVREGHVPVSLAAAAAAPLPHRHLIEELMFVDCKTYLPDDILVKVDRASMAVGLEARVPFLDHRLVEFAWRLPFRYKRRGGQSKWIVRRLLEQRLPAELLDRPKVGFGVPLDSWLRGPLRDWAEGLLAEERLASEGYFDPSPIRRKWQQHLAGQQDWHYYLWDVLMFQAWLEHH